MDIVRAKEIVHTLADGIDPTTGEPCVIGAANIGCERISDYQCVFGGDFRNTSAHIVEICFAGLGGAGLLGDKCVDKPLGKYAALQSAPLHRGNCVGDDIQLVTACCKRLADFFCVRQRINALAECVQIVLITLGWVPVKV